MNDLISRQAAIDALEREKTHCTAFRDGYTPINVFEKYNAGLTDGIKALKNLPSAQPERKEGTWKNVEDDSWAGGGYTKCSACGWGYSWGAYFEPDQWNFCPHCGAKMGGDAE